MFSLKRFDAEMQPLVLLYDTWPHADAFSASVVNDLCRRTGTVDPLPDRLWEDLGLTFPKRGVKLSPVPSSEVAQRVALLAFFLEKTSLGSETAAYLQTVRGRGFVIDRLPRFLDAVVPVEPVVGAEGNERTEFVRKLLAAMGMPIEGESAAVSRQRVEAIDSLIAKRDQYDDDRPDRVRETLRRTWAREKELGIWRQGEED